MKKIEKDIKCRCCGKTYQAQVIASRFIPDTYLDGKPLSDRDIPELYICPECHYAAVDAVGGEIDADAKSVVGGDEYQRLITSDSHVDRYKAALMSADENSERYILQGLCWSYEAAGDDKAAAETRRRLAKVIAGDIGTAPKIDDILLYVECMRRLGEFAEAGETLESISEEMEKAKGDYVYKIYSFEAALVRRGDSEQHLSSEVPAYED